MPEQLEIGAINLHGAGDGMTNVEVAYFEGIDVEMFAVVLPTEQARDICLASHPRMIEVTLDENRAVTHVHVGNKTYTVGLVRDPALN